MQYNFDLTLMLFSLALALLYSLLQAVRFALIFTDCKTPFPGPEMFRCLASQYAGIVWVMLLSLGVLGFTFSGTLPVILRYSVLGLIPVCFLVALAERDWMPLLPALAFSLTVPFFESVFGQKIFPLVLVLTLALLVSGLLIRIFRQKDEIESRVIPYSIREGLNSLDDGILFARPDGRILLSNNAMQSICRSLTGKKLRNCNKFWENIRELESTDRITKIADGDTYLFRFSGGNTWTLYRETRSSDGLNIVQYTALNITESDRARKNIMLTRATLESTHADAETVRRCERFTERLKKRNLAMHDTLLSLTREIAIQRLLLQSNSGYASEAAVRYTELASSFRLLKTEMSEELSEEEA